MMRAIFGEGLLFLVPFALFAVYLLIMRRNPLTRAAWSDQALWLTGAGLLLVIVGLIVTGLTAERHQEGFTPPRLENGRVVPGQFR